GHRQTHLETDTDRHTGIREPPHTLVKKSEYKQGHVHTHTHTSPCTHTPTRRHSLMRQIHMVKHTAISYSACIIQDTQRQTDWINTQAPKLNETGQKHTHTNTCPWTLERYIHTHQYTTTHTTPQ